MSDQQLIRLLPAHRIPAQTNRKIARQVLAKVRALASGYVEPVTREIVIVPAQGEGEK